MSVKLLVPVLLLLPTTALAQPAAELPPAAVEEEPPQDVDALIAMLEAEGAPPEAIMLFRALGDADEMDPLTLMMLMGMMGGGDMGGNDAMGMLFLMKALGGSKQPTALVHNDKLLIIEGGKVYRVDVETMELEGKVAYKGGNQAAQIMQILAPAFARGRDKARQASCLSNIKQICVAVQMYAADHDGILPGALWVDEVFPYVENRALFACPDAPELPVGYALNEALLEAGLDEIPRPAETAIVFDSDAGGDSPIGNVNSLPPGGRHNGGVNIGYADGHAKWSNAEQARTILETIPE